MLLSYYGIFSAFYNLLEAFNLVLDKNVAEIQLPGNEIFGSSPYHRVLDRVLVISIPSCKIQMQLQYVL